MNAGVAHLCSANSAKNFSVAIFAGRSAKCEWKNEAVFSRCRFSTTTAMVLARLAADTCERVSGSSSRTSELSERDRDGLRGEVAAASP